MNERKAQLQKQGRNSPVRKTRHHCKEWRMGCILRGVESEREGDGSGGVAGARLHRAF